MAVCGFDPNDAGRTITMLEGACENFMQKVIFFAAELSRFEMDKFYDRFFTRTRQGAIPVF
jgi:hypothetical protein